MVNKAVPFILTCFDTLVYYGIWTIFFIILF